MQLLVYKNIEYFIDDFVNQYVSENDFAGQVAKIISQWQKKESYYSLTTSGSTGAVKELKFSYNQLKISAKQTIDFFGLTNDDELLCCLPVNKVAGFMMIIRALEANADLIITEPSLYPLDSLKKNLSVSFAAFIPSQFEIILNQYSHYQSFFRYTKAVILGGMAVGFELSEKIKTIDTAVYETYGMTETLSHFALKKLNGENQAPFFTLLNENEIMMDENECLMVKSRITQNKWLKTNDVVEILSNNTFTIRGRADNIINTGGIKIFPESIEQRIMLYVSKFFHTERFIIAGFKNQQFGEIPVLILECVSIHKTNFELFFNSIAEVLEKYEIPWKIYIEERFSETENLKLNRKAIIENTLKSKNTIYERKR